jgi:hypothetical protein
LFGVVAGGYLLAKGALSAAKKLGNGGDSAFYSAKLSVARFYADHVLSQAPALLHPVRDGAGSVLALPEDQF